MISENIKNLRKEKGLTQKELADLLHVTAQAVSRWEQGDVEPSVDTISNMAKIFGVTTDEVIDGPDKKPQPEVITEVKEKVVIEQSKPVLAVCEHCKKPIFESDDLVINTISQGRGHQSTQYLCLDCDLKIKAEKKMDEINYASSQRIKSFIWGTVSAAAVLVCMILFGGEFLSGAEQILVTILATALTFTFVSCIFLKNNFMGDMFTGIAEWGFVSFPGLIFSFDLGGFIWLIGMKLLFWVLGFLIGCATVFLALLVCLPLSAFVYPFALIKSFAKPELTEDV